jgi:hypothetical protein
MSEIPRARRILQWALAEDHGLDTTRAAIRRALALMTRKSPAFRVEHDAEPMTDRKRLRARRMRARGMSMRKIAEVLHTNGGRVSEAINGKRKGI